MSEASKNVLQGAHKATSSQLAVKINVGLRGESGSAFFPRRRTGLPAFHTQLISIGRGDIVTVAARAGISTPEPRGAQFSVHHGLLA
jgi:hypothetical protein